MNNEHAQILIDIQKKSNITVTNNRDVSYLKEIIEAETNLVIGFNTLRRLFGFLKATTPSLVTLNTLAKYLGFSSFAAYRRNYLNYDNWYFQQNLQRMLLRRKYSKTDFYQINIGLLNSSNVVFLAYFITNLIVGNKLKKVLTLFEHIDFRAVLNTDLLKFGTILSICLSKQSEKKAFRFYNELLKYDVFRNNLPLNYVDYNNLTKRYIRILNLLKKYSSNPSDLLFVDLMNFYSLFYSNKTTQQIVIEKSRGFNTFHPVLSGRYYGYLILKNEQVNILTFNEILKECKTQPLNLFLQEIILALIFKNETEFLSQLFDLYYEEIFTSISWSSSTMHAISLIALSIINTENNNTKRARYNIELIEFDKIELSYENYITLFYYFTILKISFKDGIKSENKIASRKIKNLTKTLGFKRFLNVSNQYIIN